MYSSSPPTAMRAAAPAVRRENGAGAPHAQVARRFSTVSQSGTRSQTFRNGARA